VIYHNLLVLAENGLLVEAVAVPEGGGKLPVVLGLEFKRLGHLGRKVHFCKFLESYKKARGLLSDGFVCVMRTPRVPSQREDEFVSNFV
jgi:hypothetical protein